MIIALQYYEGDLAAAMSLARLLADIETKYRSDVLLALVCQPETPRPKIVDTTIAHCSIKFHVELHDSPLGATGHPAGCTALWTGTARLYHEKWKANKINHESIFMLDGGDGVPLHRNWIDLAKSEHAKTLSGGKLITGSPYFLGTCPLHVNPNSIFQFEVFNRTKLLIDVPKYDGTLSTNFDIYHRVEMLENANLSSIVRTDWRGGGYPMTRELLFERSLRSIWLHGHKDPALHFTAREHLTTGTGNLQLKHYDIDQLLKYENVRRCYEESCRYEEACHRSSPGPSTTSG